jgi:hypothetical protein
LRTRFRKPLSPVNTLAFTAGDRGAQVLVHALARDAAKPLEGMDVPLQERVHRHLHEPDRV